MYGVLLFIIGTNNARNTGSNTGAAPQGITSASIGSSGVSGLNRNQEMVYCAIREGGSLGINIEKVQLRFTRKYYEYS